MKIAVATMDGVSTSQHFGRSSGFVVFDVEGQSIQGQQFRTNGHKCDGNHNHGAGGHSHSGVAGLLSDCQIVLCGGMGAGAAQALMQLGIQPAIVSGPCSAEDAVKQFLSGTTASAQHGFCQCHH